MRKNGKVSKKCFSIFYFLIKVNWNFKYSFSFNSYETNQHVPALITKWPVPVLEFLQESRFLDFVWSSTDCISVDYTELIYCFCLDSFRQDTVYTIMSVTEYELQLSVQNELRQFVMWAAIYAVCLWQIISPTIKQFTGSCIKWEFEAAYVD